MFTDLVLFPGSDQQANIVSRGKEESQSIEQGFTCASLARTRT